LAPGLRLRDLRRLIRDEIILRLDPGRKAPAEQGEAGLQERESRAIGQIEGVPRLQGPVENLGAVRGVRRVDLLG
jgi:hypothetical protein